MQVHVPGVEGDQDRGAAQRGGDVQQVLVAVVLHSPAEIAHPLDQQPQAARGAHGLVGEGGKLGVPVLSHTSSVRLFRPGRPRKRRSSLSANRCTAATHDRDWGAPGATLLVAAAVAGCLVRRSGAP
ncbi:hypothetical protein [Kitasatospora sp. NPDC047058]|uniref:hypothetical protein n=1 Tax=Kitasatospora sp. NPDC047058 TaxID=3155620 RepID=UPI0033E4B0D2